MIFESIDVNIIYVATKRRKNSQANTGFPVMPGCLRATLSHGSKGKNHLDKDHLRLKKTGAFR